jgi:hypothetical protein
MANAVQGGCIPCTACKLRLGLLLTLGLCMALTNGEARPQVTQERVL